MTDRKDRSVRLGRGLAALLGDPDTPSDGVARELPIASLLPGPFQPRQHMAPEPLDELASSIRTHGILQPILVRHHPEGRDTYQIVAGERRWRAAQIAGLHVVPVHVRDLDDRQALASSLIENLQREDLNAIEEAEGLRRLATDFELTQEALADAVGKSRSHVTNMLRLLALPPGVQIEVRRGALSAGHARALVRHPDPERAALSVVSRGLNVRQTEALSRPAGARHVQTAPTDAHFELRDLERRLAARLGLKTRITFDGRGGRIELTYRSTEQLEGLLTLLAPPQES